MRGAHAACTGPEHRPAGGGLLWAQGRKDVSSSRSCRKQGFLAVAL
jgi:hypothetical protein